MSLKSMSRLVVFLITVFFLPNTGISHGNEEKQEPLKWQLTAAQVGIGLTPAPIDITGLKEGNQTVSFKEGNPAILVAKEDLLKNAEILLINSSNKTINFITVEILYYTDDSKTLSAYLEAGIGRFTFPLGSKADTWIQPGQKVSIKIEDLQFEKLANAVQSAQTRGTLIHRLKFKVSHFMFDGEPDLMWRKGVWMKREANNPSLFRAINKISHLNNARPTHSDTGSANGLSSKTTPFTGEALTSSLATWSRAPFGTLGLGFSAPAASNRIFSNSRAQNCMGLTFFGFYTCGWQGDYECVRRQDYLDPNGFGSWKLEWNFDYCEAGWGGSNICLIWDYVGVAVDCD